MLSVTAPHRQEAICVRSIVLTKAKNVRIERSLVFELLKTLGVSVLKNCDSSVSPAGLLQEFGIGEEACSQMQSKAHFLKIIHEQRI